MPNQRSQGSAHDFLKIQSMLVNLGIRRDVDDSELIRLYGDSYGIDYADAAWYIIAPCYVKGIGSGGKSDAEACPYRAVPHWNPI